MANLKVSKEMASAAMIHAMLTGETIEKAAEIKDEIDIDNVDMDESEDEVINGIEVDIDLDGKKKKSRKGSGTKAKKVKKTDEEIAAEKAAADRLPECEFADLKKSEKFIVVLNHHEIHYKEQRWPIEERKVVYEASRVDSRLSAKRVVRSMYGDRVTQEQIDKADSGEVRYYEIRVLNEVVPTRVTCLGYIEIKKDKKNIIRLFKQNLETHNISYDEVLKDVKKVVKLIATYN